MKTSTVLAGADPGISFRYVGRSWGRSLLCDIKAQADAGRVHRTTEFIWDGAREDG